MEATKPKVQLKDAPDDVLIAKFVALRDARAERKKAFEASDVDDKRKQEKIEIELLRRLNERGTDSTSSKSHGTAYRNVKASCSVADWDAFLEGFVIPNQAWDFLNKAANKTMVAAFKDEQHDLPPGLNWTEVVTIGVRRS